MLKPPIYCQLFFTFGLFAAAVSADGVADGAADGAADGVAGRAARVDALDLYEACHQPRSAEPAVADASLCQLYIQGFLDASGTADKPGPEQSAFFERALRTRAGGWLSRSDEKSRQAYCIPAGTTIDEVATRLSGTTPRPSDKASARQFMTQVLSAHFPCQ